MRILIYGINYAPELTGIGKYTGEMAAWLAKKGHDVHVMTTLPYYPEWQVHASYKGKKWHTEILDGVKVHRVPIYVPKEVNSKKRILHEFTFFVSGFPKWVKQIGSKKFDIVFCVAPPFHLGFAPLFYKFFKKTALINHIQDLQVDAAKDLGMIKNKRFLDIMFGMERYILTKSTMVSTISKGMQQKIMAKGIPEKKILLFPNWVDESVIYPLNKEHSLRKEFGIEEEKKVVLYSGNLGEKQGLEIIINVAKSFGTDVLFLICGSGGGRDKLIRMAEMENVTNIRFQPLQPYEKLSALLASADVHLVLQKKSAADLVMPSKLTGILAAGGCAVVTAEPGTSLYEVIYEKNAGILVTPESESALTEGIKKALYHNNDLVRLNARRYAEECLSKEQIMSVFEKTLKDLVENN